MWWLIILAAVIAAVLILLCIPVAAHIRFEGELSIVISYLFLRFRVYPQKPKKEKERRKQKSKKLKQSAEAGKKEPVGALIAKYGVAETIKLISQTAVKLPAVVIRIFRGARLRRLRLKLGIAGEDAAQTAIGYGEVCSVFYPVYGALSSYLKIIGPQVDIHADYASEKTQISASGKLYVTPLHIVVCVLGGLKDIIKLTGIPKKSKKVA